MLRLWLTVLTILGLAAPLGAQTRYSRLGSDERFDWWHEARFGFFFHWELAPSRMGDRSGSPPHGPVAPSQAAANTRARLADFEPSSFDATAWTRFVRKNGMRYILATAKNIDGFCLFDSRQTEFDVMSTPFARDVIGELAAAAREEGLRFGLCVSVIDGDRRDSLVSPSAPDAEQRFARYVTYLRAQIEELLTQYGTIDALWLIGEEAPSWTVKHRQELIALCRELQPGILINGRFDSGSSHHRGLPLIGEAERLPSLEPPPYDGGDIGSAAFASEDLARMQESCLPFQSSWGFPGDEHSRSAEEILRSLICTATRSSNLLLNSGPRSDGSVPPRLEAVMKDVGLWLESHGAAIYGTRGGPSGLSRSESCGTTWKRGEDGRETIYCLMMKQGPLSSLMRHLATTNEPASVHWQGSNEPVCFDDEPLAIPAGEPLSVLVAEYDGPVIVPRAPRLHVLGVDWPTYRFFDELTVDFEPGFANHVLRYTLDGSQPDLQSPVFTGPLTLRESTKIRLTSFVGEEAIRETEYAFEKVSPQPALSISADSLEPGFRYRQYADINRNATFVGEPVREGIVRDLAELRRGAPFAVELAGVFYLPEPGLYEFAIIVQDTARARIGEGRMRLCNGGVRAIMAGPRTHRTLQLEVLEEGYHRLDIQYFNLRGDHLLDIRHRRVGDAVGDWEPLLKEVMHLED